MHEYTGVPIPCRTNRRQAVSSTSNTTTQWTPWSNHNQVCTIMNREPTLHPCTSYHTRIMHGEGVGTADSTTTTLDTKVNDNNSYPSKDPEYYTQRSLTHQYITQRKTNIRCSTQQEAKGLRVHKISNDTSCSYCPRLLTGNPKLLVNVNEETIWSTCGLGLCTYNNQQSTAEYGSVLARHR